MEYPPRMLNKVVRCTNGICLVIRYQYFRFIHIMPSTSPGYTQGNTLGRHDDAVLRGAVGAEDDGARVVHNSTATKNTSLQSVRDMMVIAMP